MRDLQVGDRVKVNIEEAFYETCKKINGATGTITSKDKWIYPYTVKLDDEQLDRLIREVESRRFDGIELIKINE